MHPLAPSSYLAGAIAFALLLTLLLTRWRGRPGTGGLALACLASVVWCLGLAAFAAEAPIGGGWLLVFEPIRGAAWLILILGLLRGEQGLEVPARARWVVHGVWLGALVYGAWRTVAGPAGATPKGLILSALLIALTGIVLVEQLYRNAPADRRWALKYFCLGVGGMFAYDLYLYADGLLFGSLDAELWQSRGAVNAMVVPLLAIAVARTPEGATGLIISRRLAFYTTSLAAVGVYLLAMAAGGYYVRSFGGTWGALAQIVFFFGAGVLLLITLFSGQARAYLKVFLSKHFYSYKYDYRDEWLRLIRLLFAADTDQSLTERALRAVADIVESPNGGLWLAGDAGYAPVAGDLAGPDSPVVPLDGALPAFLSEKEWIIDLDEYRAQTALYDGLQLPGWLLAEQRAWLILPLLQGDRLFGFMVLARPRATQALDWEDLDLLKTVGRQVAGALAQREAAQQLAETRQFEAFNRLTAFIMHDLNNLIAQQSLVVKNAARHKDNPEFIEDAIQTVDNSVRRMSRLLEQLQRGEHASPARRTELRALCERVVGSCAERRPAPVLEAGPEQIHALVGPERFAMVLRHVVRNAQDATPDDGEVRLRVFTEHDKAVIEIVDTGCGMPQHFLRERLFRPFDSTKGSKGMGIGAYQTREFVRAAHGDVQVQSRPGDGTRFRIRLPLAGGDIETADEQHGGEPALQESTHE